MTEIQQLKEELDEALDKIKELKDEIDTLEESNDELNETNGELIDKINDLELELYQSSEYDNTIQSIEEIHWQATNFKDKELMEALQACIERGTNINSIIELLEHLK